MGEEYGRQIADSWRRIKQKPLLWTRCLDRIELPLISAQPRVALCIATLGRIEELDRLFHSLVQQNYSNFHIYIADQNPPGMLDELLYRYRKLPITRIMIPSKGVSFARNRLLSCLNHESIVAFPDDDCWYSKDTLEQVIINFRKFSNAGALLGKNIINKKPLLCSYTEIKKIGTFRHAETYLQFFRTSAIKDVKFDQQLGPGNDLPYGCGEDTDFLLKVYERTSIFRCSDIHIYHYYPENLMPSDKKIASYASGRMYLLRKYHFPLWFRCANVLYPLLILPIDWSKHGYKMLHYRFKMFIERLKNF